MAEKTEKPQKQKRPQKAGKGTPGKAREAAAVVEAKPREPEPKIPARLRVKFEQEVAASLMRELKIENRMRVPRLEKITINMALNEARDNVKILDSAVEELSQIAGQKPVRCRGCATSAGSVTRPLMAAATTRWACASTPFFRNSTSTRSRK